MIFPLLESGEIDIEDIRPQATPFAMLGMQPAFDLDMAVLERHYVIMQNELHPDRFVGKPNIEMSGVRMMSAWVNTAYKKLKDPVLRAKALLKVLRAKIPGEGDGTVADPIILENAMEWREELETLKSPQEFDHYQAKINSVFDNCKQQFSKAWDNHNTEEMQRAYLNMTYASKALDEAKEKRLFLSGIFYK
jgi:molecular chaperone HscB